MTVNAKSIRHFLSFVVHLFLRRLPNFLNDFLAAGCFLLLSTCFCTSSNVGPTLRVFFTLSHSQNIHATWAKTKFTYVCIIYIEFIFPSSLPKSGYTLKTFLSSFWAFWKEKKTNACFNLGLVIHFELRVFAVRHTAIVTTATAFGFFRPFPCFVWNFCC